MIDAIIDNLDKDHDGWVSK